MSLDAAQHRSGKGSGDENFPVASWLVAKPHRRPILAFYEFVRIADDIADHATLPPDEKLAHLDSLEGSLLGHNDRQCGRRDAARGAGRAQSHAAARAGSAAGVPAGRHQAPLQRLGRPDRLLPLFGHAGRALRARRARREPRDLAGLGQCLRGAADHQSPAGLREGLPQHSTASIFRSMRSQAAGASVEALRRAARDAGNCCACLHGLADRTGDHAGSRARICPGRSGTRGLRWKSPPL